MDLGEIENFFGMTMVALSCVHKLSHLLNRPILFERFKKFYRSYILSIVIDAYTELDLKFYATEERFLDCGDRIKNIFLNNMGSPEIDWVKVTK